MKTTWHSVLNARWTCLVIVSALLALRLPHLTGPIDDPHSWRQSDTAYYALSLYREGFDLLRPRVCWSGEHDVLALEFPLHEALIALLYRLFGFDHLWARLVTLAFFAGSTVYLFVIVDMFSTRRLACLATFAYALLPLSLFYSRAIHVDFCAVFFAHAMLFHLLRGFEHGRRLDIVLGALFGSTGFAIKAPYLFYLYLPLGVFLLRRKVWRKPYRWWLTALAVPALAFLLWRWNVGLVNADKPALDIYPKFVQRLDWYFGSLDQRLDIGNWLVLTQRLVFDVANPIGLLLFAWGAWIWVRSAKSGYRWFFTSWALGAILYVVLFFGLNWAHNYYQIPLTAVAAVLIGVCLDRFIEIRAPFGPILAALLALAFAATSLWYANRVYYHVDWRAVQAGQLIEAHTSESDLIVAYLYDDNFEYSDPRLLYRARRRGWSIRPQDITPERMAIYASEGGHFLAIVVTEPDERLTPTWLQALDGQRFALRREGEALGTLHLYDLSTLASPAQ
jgi:hypothetical protein